MSLLVRRLRPSHLHLPPSPPSPSLITPPFSSSIHRLPFSTAATQVPSPNPPFAVQYLIQSCGLPPDKALWASKRTPHLKSPDKPDAILRFLRQTGLSESDITAAVARDPRILCSHLDKIWRPNVAKLQEVGLSAEDISRIISRGPIMFCSNFVPKIDFWVGALGSVENFSAILKTSRQLLTSNLEKVTVPNLSFLREQCGLSIPQIVRLIKSAPRLIRSNPEALKINAKRAEELGVRCPSPMFLYALIIVSCVSQRTIDVRLNNLKSFGLSQKELSTLVSKLPLVLTLPEEVIGRKIEFLTKEVGCDMLSLVSNVCLLTCSLEKRLIPRNLVRKLLELKGLPVANLKFASFVRPNEKGFVEKFVLPYDNAIPGLHRAYADACAGKVAGIEGFRT